VSQDLEEQLRTHDAALQHLRAEIAGMKQDIALLEREVSSVHTDIRKATANADKNREHLEALHVRVVELKGDILALSGEIGGRIEGASRITNYLIGIVSAVAAVGVYFM
jgi:uncharacterized coiled-coil DUF342 family protein